MTMRSTLRILGVACIWPSYLPLISAFRLGSTPDQTLSILLKRDQTCANSSLTSCASVDRRLPGNFCCTSGQFCISLDSSSSALCCPDGASCSQIQPLSCNVTSQNPELYPGASVQTTRLHDNLPACGNGCCPFGYTCSSQGSGDNLNSFCTLNTDTSIIGSSSASSPATTAATSADSTTFPSATSTATTSGIDSNTTRPTTQCSRFPGGAIAAGFFPGLLAGALLMLLGVLFFGSRNPDSRPSSHNSSLYKPYFPMRSADGTITGVSGPIPVESQGARTDFLHRTTSRARSFFSPRSDPDQDGYGYPSQENWKMPTPPAPNNIPMEPVGKLVPVTPQRQTRGDRHVTKEPSTESIRVYSPAALSRAEVPIIPVRGMKPQNKELMRTAIGSPFKTPPTNKYTNPDGSISERGEMLTPARYDDGKRREKGDERDMSRPVTTFTDMLSEINFPDPGRDQTPTVPTVPKGVDWSKKGKRR
jgi:hypothetical protein